MTLTLTEVLETAVEGEEFIKPGGVVFFDGGNLRWRSTDTIVWASRANADGWERVVPKPKPPEFVEWPRITRAMGEVAFMKPSGAKMSPCVATTEPGFVRFRFPDWIEKGTVLSPEPHMFRVWANQEQTAFSYSYQEHSYNREVLAEAAVFLSR